MRRIKKLSLFIYKNKWLVLGVFLLLILAYFYHNKIFSIHFVDEEDNFVLGKFLLENKKLYSDLFSHHQPLGYIMSAGIQAILDLPNIFMMVKRHREFMILWSLIWGIVLLLRFNYKVLLPLLIYELTKFYLFGNLFLSESLAVYPMIYLVLHLLQIEKRVTKYELFFIGILFAFVAFILAPVWPLLFAYLLLLIWFKKVGLKDVIYFVIGGILVLIFCIPFIDIYYYFHNVFYINFVYYIPIGDNERQPMAFIKAFLTPFTILIQPVAITSYVLLLKAIAVLFFITLILLIKLKEYKLIILSVVVLTLANFRYVNPFQDYYRGFHILVWYVLFIIITAYFSYKVLQQKKSILIRGLIFIPSLLIIFFSIGASLPLFQKSDINHDYYVNFSRQYTFGEAIRIMKSPEDTLFVIPDEWLLYWQGDVKNVNKMVNYYPWMEQVPELSGYVKTSFQTNPPTFFYCDCNPEKVYYFSSLYTQMRKDGKETLLWVLDSKLKQLSEQQKNSLRFHNFEI